MSSLLDRLNKNRARRENNSEGSPQQQQNTIQTIEPDNLSSPTVISPYPLIQAESLLQTSSLSPLQRGLVQAYVTKVPAKLQKALPTIPKVLDRLPSQLFALIGFDITPEQKAKLAILEKSPEEIIAKFSPEVLHAYVRALCTHVETLLAQDQAEGIGTGNGSPGLTGQQPDNSSRGVSEREVNAYRVDGFSQTAEQPPVAESVH